MLSIDESDTFFHFRSGDCIDILDDYGVWNVAQVINYVSEKEMVIEYDGWGPKFREKVSPQSNKIAPFQTFTWEAKCWAKYENYPWWPAVVAIRVPGTEKGKRYLELENKLHVDFLDNKDLSKRTRCWLPKNQIENFCKQRESRQSEYYGKEFEHSLQNLMQSTAAAKVPKFGRGILPRMLEFAQIEPLNMIRNKQGEKAWRSRYSSGRERYRLVYVFTDDSSPSSGSHTRKEGMRLTKSSETKEADRPKEKQNPAESVRRRGRPKGAKNRKKLSTNAKSPAPQAETASGQLCGSEQLVTESRSVRLKNRTLSGESTRRCKTNQPNNNSILVPPKRKKRKRTKSLTDAEAEIPMANEIEQTTEKNIECERIHESKSADPSTLWKEAILAYRQMEKKSTSSLSNKATNDRNSNETKPKETKFCGRWTKAALKDTPKQTATPAVESSEKEPVDIVSDATQIPAAVSTSEEQALASPLMHATIKPDEVGKIFSHSNVDTDRSKKNKVIFILSSRKSRKTSHKSSSWAESEDVPTHSCNDTKAFRLCHWFASNLQSLRAASQKVKDACTL